MRGLGKAEARLAEILLKTACAFVFGNPAVATMTSELAGWAVQGAARERKREIRTIRAELHNLVDTIAEHVVTQYGREEFRAVPVHERAAAIIAVAGTFEDQTVFDVASTDLSAQRMLACLRARRATVLATELLAPDAVELYDLVLERTCRQLVVLLGQLPDVRTAAYGEILSRLRTLVEQAIDAPEKLFARVARSNDAQFTDFYRQHGPRALAKADLHTPLLALHRRYPLIEAYLHCPARIYGRPGGDGVLPAEHALAGTSRLWVTGDPGVGKTTLMKRLFWLAAREAFAAPLSALNGHVPFYVPLRSHGGLPEPSKFLDPVLRTWSGSAPRGWVERQLRAGRALIMANGFDELPAPLRGTALDRLTDFAEEVTGNGNVVILTSRRAALPPRWEERAGFRCVELLPFGATELAAFVLRWHDAALAACPDPREHDRIRARRDALLAALARSSHLRVLATNPLCCALLCALHLERDIRLPADWIALIELVLTALADRDTDRGVPEPATLSPKDLLALERDFAYWMVTNGGDPVDLHQAERRVEKTLSWMGIDGLDVAAVLADLVCRSSVLRTLPDGRIVFANPVVRDHLAAGEFLSGSDIGYLRREARSRDRHRLIVAALGRARGAARDELVTGLLGDARDNPDDADWLRLLVGDRGTAGTAAGAGAGAGAAGAAGAAGDTAGAAGAADSADTAGAAGAGGAGESGHPGNGVAVRLSRAAVALGAQGTDACEFLLDQLPELDGLDETRAAEVVRAAVELARVVGVDGLPVLARFAADDRQPVQRQLWEAWPGFDRVQYARLVLSACPTCPGEVVVDCQAVVVAVADHLPAVQAMTVSGGCCVDLSPLAGRPGLCVAVGSHDDVRGAELLGEGSSVVVRVGEGEVADE